MLQLTPTREIAYDAFIRVMVNKHDPDEVSGELLAKALSGKPKFEASKLDRRFIKEILFGSLRWYSKIFWILQNTSKRDLNKVEPEILSALILGTYQIFYMDRVPDRAAVNESVEYVKKKGLTKASPFVNGILRNISRRAEYFPKPDKEKMPAKYLALQYAHPQWMVERWLKDFNFDRLKDILASNNIISPLTIRVNALKMSTDHMQEFRNELLRREKIHSEKSNLRGCLQLEEFPQLEAGSLFSEGFYTFQDEASQLIGHLVSPKKGETILDVCSGPGGKTTHLFELCEGECELYGIEKNQKQIFKAQENALRLGHEKIKWIQEDFLKWTPDSGISPDRILVDAPCSGMGVLRKHPEGKWHKTEKNILDLAKLQREILTKAWSLLKPGGELVYSVCSFEPEETLEQLKWMKTNFSVKVISPVSRLTDSYKKYVTRDNLLLIFPGNKEGMDGFGAFVLQKTE